MKYKYLLQTFFLFIFSASFSQNQIMADGIYKTLKIENSANIPIIVENGDGTLTLKFQDQYVSDIFAKYKIYDFYIKSPENFQEYYTIIFNNKDLINELHENVPPETIYVSSSTEPLYASTPISQDIIHSLDGISFDILKYISLADHNCVFYDCNGNPFCTMCILNDVPNDFNFSIIFNYNAEKDMFYVKSDGVSPCGNAFSIGLKGGEPDNYIMQNGQPSLQLWEVFDLSPVLSSFSETCYNIETILYKVLGIFIYEGFTNLWVNIDQETNHLRLRKDNAVFGEEFVEFSEVNLSTEDKSFQNIKLISPNNNPFIEFTGVENSNFHIEIFDILGNRIIKKTPYRNNSFSLNTYPSGLYIIKLSSSNSAFKTFKLVK